MDSLSEPPAYKKLKQDDKKESNNSFQHKSLISIFMEFFWDEEDGPYYGWEEIELRKWIETVGLYEYIDAETIWNEDIPQLDIREETKILLTENIKSNEILFRKAQKTNESIKWARLIWKMKYVLVLLLECNDSINYTDAYGETILYAFFYGYHEKKAHENLSQDQLVRLRKLVKQLLARGASFYDMGGIKVCPLHLVAAFPDQKLLELVLSCILDNVDVKELEKIVNSIFTTITNLKTVYRIVAACKNEDMLQIMISQLKDYRNVDGDTALHMHILYDSNNESYAEIVQRLVSQNANLVNMKNNKGMTPLHLASAKFHVDFIQLFAINGADFNQCTEEDENCLHLACKSTVKLQDNSRIVETIDWLVSYGCDLEAVDKKGFMPLHYAAELGVIEIIDRLLKLGTKVDCQMKGFLKTPLHLAAENDRFDIMKKLLESGADINAETFTGRTAIFESVLQGSFETVQYLVDHGADLYRREKFLGYSLIHWIAFRLNTTKQQRKSIDATGVLNIRDDEQILNYLLTKGFDVNDPATCRIIPLQLSLLTNNLNIIKKFIEYGADVNFQNDECDLTALHIATMMMNKKAIEMLINAGADVNRRGGINQWTPLHFALAENIDWKLGRFHNNVPKNRRISTIISKQNIFDVYENSPHLNNIIDILIKNGADIDLQDTSGKTPLHLATVRRFACATKLLLNSGANPNLQDNDGQLPLFNALKYGQKKAFKHFFDAGVDINDTDVSQLIMESQNDELKKHAAERAIKFKLLGLPISKVYESLIDKPAFSAFSMWCSRELDILKSLCINESLTVYQFLRLDIKQQYDYVEEIKKSYESLEKHFPTYFSIIRVACHEATMRKSLLESAKIAWIKITNINLRANIVERILSHLNNRYLKVLVDSANLNEKLLVNDEDSIPAIRGEIKTNKVMNF